MFGELTLFDNIYFLMPEIFLSITIVILFTQGIIYSKLGGKISQQKKITWLSILTIIFAIGITLQEKFLIDSLSNLETNQILIAGGFLTINSLNLMIKIVVLLGGLGILLLSLDYYAEEKSLAEYEYTQLILISLLGMLLLVSSSDLIMFYLSIELISLSLYILAAFRRHGQFSTEAGLKYFLLGALSSGLLLFGCGLIYTITGLTGFNELSYYLWYGTSEDLIGVKAGALFIVIALLFKLAAAPFHMWAPDVYEGSPTIVTAYFAIVPKIAILGILVSFLLGPFYSLLADLQPIILFSAIFSVFVASIGGINQTKIKRLLAYSAIGHIGFMLIGIAQGSIYGLQASFVYIIIYIIMSFTTFSIILSLFKQSQINNYLSEFSGLSRTEPVLAITFALSLLSIAGIPPLAGFFSKYLILLSAIESEFYLVSIITVICSVIACFYYLRIIKWMYFRDSVDYYFKDLGDIIYKNKGQATSLIQALILGFTFFLSLTLLIYPNTLLIITFDSIANSLI